MRYLKILLFIIILLPFSVKAALCDYSEKIRLQRLAQNITYSYDYIEDRKEATFTFTFNNLNNELYLVDTRNNKRFDYSGEELVLGGFYDDKSYKFEVRTTNTYCDSTALYYIYITTPAYNPYYNDPICEGLDYKYCNKWQKNTFSYDEFINDINTYKQTLIIEPSNKEEIKGIFDYIIEIYSRYYYIVLPLIIIASITYIIIERKRNNLF